MGARILTGALLFLGAAAVAAPAFAQSAAGAEQLFLDGRRLLRERQFAEACERFAASQALQPSVGAQLNLGECHEKQGHTATAWGHYREAAALAQGQGDAEREQIARVRAAALEGRLARLTIVCAGGEARCGEIRRDGLVVPPAAWGKALPVDPGPHTVQAGVQATGAAPWRTSVVVEEGAALRVEVPLLAAPSAARAVATFTPRAEAPAAAPLAPAPLGTARPPASSGGLGTQRIAAIAVAAGGAAGLVVSGYLAVRARSLYEDARPRCNAENLCDSVGYAGVQAARRTGDAALVTTLVSVALLGAGGALWLTAPSSHAIRAEARVGPGAASIVLGGVF